MTKWPIFVEICRTLKRYRFLLQCQWIQKNKQLCILSTADSQGFVSREMHHSCVELVKFFNSVYPLFVNLNKLFYAFHELICAKTWHIQVFSRLKEAIEVLLSSECLQWSFSWVLNNAYAFMDRNSVMKHSGRSLELDFSVWDDLWLVPPGFFRVIDRKHVVCKSFTEDVVFFDLWLDFAHIPGFYFYFRSLHEIRRIWEK